MRNIYDTIFENIFGTLYGVIIFRNVIKASNFHCNWKLRALHSVALTTYFPRFFTILAYSGRPSPCYSPHYMVYVCYVPTYLLFLCVWRKKKCHYCWQLYEVYWWKRKPTTASTCELNLSIMTAVSKLLHSTEKNIQVEVLAAA